MRGFIKGNPLRALFPLRNVREVVRTTGVLPSDIVVVDSSNITELLTGRGRRTGYHPLSNV